MGKMIKQVVSPAFLRGFSRVFDLGANMSNYSISRTPERDDYEALKGDWEKVGQCIKEATERYAKANAI